MSRGPTFALVLLGDLVSLAVVFCIDDPLRYATPLMLLFPSIVAAWFLGRIELAVNMAVTVVVCLVALWPSYDSAVGLGVQVGVDAGMLNGGALGVFLLRRRVERLLVATRTQSLLDPLTGLHNRRHLVAQAPRLWRQARRRRRRPAGGRHLAGRERPPDRRARPHRRRGTGRARAGRRPRRGGPARRAPADRRRHHPHRRRARGHGIGRHRLTGPTDAEDATDELWRLIDRADAAMYEAKQQGRDRVASLWVPLARVPPAEESTSRLGTAASDGA